MPKGDKGCQRVPKGAKGCQRVMVIGGGVISRINFPQFWVKEVSPTGTMARHDTQTGQKCRDDRSPFNSTVRKGTALVLGNCGTCAL